MCSTRKMSVTFVRVMLKIGRNEACICSLASVWVSEWSQGCRQRRWRWSHCARGSWDSANSCVGVRVAVPGWQLASSLSHIWTSVVGLCLLAELQWQRMFAWPAVEKWTQQVGNTVLGIFLCSLMWFGLSSTCKQIFRSLFRRLKTAKKNVKIFRKPRFTVCVYTGFFWPVPSV